MRFEIEVELDSKIYEYIISFEFPENFKEPRILEEKLTAEKKTLYTRQAAQVYLAKTHGDREAKFLIDWHLVALPIIQDSEGDPLFIFKQWLARMFILRPTPSLILGDSTTETLQPNAAVTDFGAWFTGLLAYAPAIYTDIDTYLKQVMPDLVDIQNPKTGTDSRSLIVQFSSGQRRLRLPFENLSDGEKCFMICALVIAANNAHERVLCFWDEPDNHLAIDEVGQFILALRRTFQSGGQFIATTHNQETVRHFSREDILYLYRRTHLDPTLIRPINDLQISGDLVNALIRGDVEP